MPTTLVGLVLFAGLLTPGFCFLVASERWQAPDDASPLRETAQIVAASLACDSVVIGLFALLKFVGLPGMPDTAALVRDAGAYFEQHYALVIAWGIGALLVASAIGYIAGGLWGQRGSVGGPISGISGWSYALTRHPSAVVVVYCDLVDGGYIEGRLASWTPIRHDSNDRAIVLQPPIKVRSAGTSEVSPWRVGMAVIPASQVRTLGVGYFDDEPPMD